MSDREIYLRELRRRLESTEDEWMTQDSGWNGDTESGFHSEPCVNFDRLLAEIDKFSEEFKTRKLV